LALVVVLGVGAFLAPSVGIGKTGAIYTDSETAGFDVTTNPPPPTTAPTDPAATPTDPAASPTDPTPPDPATTAPTDPGADPTADPSATPAAPVAMVGIGALQAAASLPTITPTAPTTQPTGHGHAHTPGPVGPLPH
jgi:hypothetical protein